MTRPKTWRAARAIALGAAVALQAAAPDAGAQPADASAAAARLATPVGLWKSIDDKTGQPKALVRITEDAGRLTGRIEKLFDPSRPDPVCDACTDERKGKPIVGLTIIQDLRRLDDHWGDGKILDPQEGKLYSVKVTPVEGGKKLEVRGFVGLPLLGRTQTWIREQ